MTETIAEPAVRNEKLVNRLFPQPIDNRYSGSKIALCERPTMEGAGQHRLENQVP